MPKAAAHHAQQGAFQTLPDPILADADAAAAAADVDVDDDEDFEEQHVRIGYSHVDYGSADAVDVAADVDSVADPTEKRNGSVNGSERGEDGYL